MKRPASSHHQSLSLIPRPWSRARPYRRLIQGCRVHSLSVCSSSETWTMPMRCNHNVVNAPATVWGSTIVRGRRVARPMRHDRSADADPADKAEIGDIRHHKLYVQWFHNRPSPMKSAPTLKFHSMRTSRRTRFNYIDMSDSRVLSLKLICQKYSSMQTRAYRRWMPDGIVHHVHFCFCPVLLPWMAT